MSRDELYNIQQRREQSSERVRQETKSSDRVDRKRTAIILQKIESINNKLNELLNSMNTINKQYKYVQKTTDDNEVENFFRRKRSELSWKKDLEAIPDNNIEDRIEFLKKMRKRRV